MNLRARLEAHQQTIDMSTRAHPFDNLLTDVAAFVEMKSTHVTGFISDGRFVGVHAYARDARFNADDLVSLITRSYRSGSFQLRADIGNSRRRSPQPDTARDRELNQTGHIDSGEH